jgi:hypothetical protein
MILKKMDKLFLRTFSQELFNVFIIELIAILTVGLIFFLVLVILYVVSWLWRIGIIFAMIFGIKLAHVRAVNKLKLIESTPVILYD